ncbi:hypothetical protein, partial [Youngiibacter fragilis]|uniref:hypothetical protein n=1 Tax=Youngiibacter fragilis TaxID=1408819 RepID=UPI001A9A64EA
MVSVEDFYFLDTIYASITDKSIPIANMPYPMYLFSPKAIPATTNPKAMAANVLSLLGFELTLPRNKITKNMITSTLEHL